MNIYDIIIKPVITEKSMATLDAKRYTFRVQSNATKSEIAKAVEELFNVSVEKVSTVNVRGKLRRQGRNQGYSRAWKKAYVTLKPDSKEIEFFEGMM